MTRFSIIVPHLGHVELFEDTLASLLRHRPANSQLIVVHEGAYDDPYELSNEVKFIAADGQPDLIQFLNIGMCYVGGEITVLIRPGMEVDENWERLILKAFESERIGAVSPIIVSTKHPSRIVTAGVELSQTGSRRLAGCAKRISNRTTNALSPLGPSSWLAAYRTRILKLLLPFDELLDSVYLDLDVAMAIEAIGFKNQVVSEWIGTIDSAEPILDESRIPHGASAQRSHRRYQNVKLASFLRCLGIDLLQSTWQPRKIRHLLQRFSAARLARHDTAYSKLLTRLRNNQVWLDQVEPITDTPSDLPYRRAA